MTQAPRDVDLAAWLDGIAFHPADSEAKRTAHEYARAVVAGFGAALHDILPPGRDKSIVYTLLEDVLMRANRALAINGGADDTSDVAMETMRQVIVSSERIFSQVDTEPAKLDPDPMPADALKVESAPGLVEVWLSQSLWEATAPNEVEELAARLLTARNQAWPAA